MVRLSLLTGPFFLSLYDGGCVGMATFFLEKKQAGGCLLKHTYTPGGYKIQGGKILPSLVFSFLLLLAG